jgi:hypothetical protein
VQDTVKEAGAAAAPRRSTGLALGPTSALAEVLSPF